MVKKKATKNATERNERLGVPGGDKLTNAELLAAQIPAQEVLAKYECAERNRLKSTAVVARERWPNESERIDRWYEAQIGLLADTVGGLRDSIQAFLDRQEEGAKFRSAFLDMTPAQVDQYLLAHTIDAAWLAGFTRNETVKREYLRSVTEAARSAKAKKAIERHGLDWRESAREIAKGNDPKTGRPWTTKKRMHQYVADLYNKDPETVRKALKKGKPK